MATVLIVEDEFGIAEVLEALLGDAGHRVLTAVNGEHGLRRLAEVTPDIVFLDYMMPVMDGPATLRAMQS
ncbi:MAG: response regulator, partial [Acetobacteraceae bacterium]|nr:response regulator [Acetobacteraceae bacterium]